MHRILTLFGVSSLSVMISKPQQKSAEFFPKKILSDTLPDICRVLPAEDITKLFPFTNLLTKFYAEEPLEGYRACIYEFWKPNDYGTIKVSVTKKNQKLKHWCYTIAMSPIILKCGKEDLRRLRA